MLKMTSTVIKSVLNFESDWSVVVEENNKWDFLEFIFEFDDVIINESSIMTQHYHKCEEVFYSFCAQVQMFKESHILAFIAVIFP